MVADEINAQWSAIGAEGFALQADCSDHLSAKQLFDQILGRYGTIDILVWSASLPFPSLSLSLAGSHLPSLLPPQVNNAGIKRDRLSIKMKPEDFTDVLTTNIHSAFYCSQLAFSVMMRKRTTAAEGGRGRIVNIASIVGQVGNTGQANYAASKGGVIAMTRALAKEYAAKGVCVNAVCPGYIESEMVQDLYRPSADSADTATDERLEKLLQTIPLRRLGKPSEVASLVSFLCVDVAGGYMTGHCLNIDGGVAIGAT
jgi:3-oxoacyl-[acyl-carrier protein] reductase